jgi:hypothetical protein
VNSYPLYYCPEGISPPEHCPHVHNFRARDGAGPDGGTGTFYASSGDIPAGLNWKQTDKGWWFAIGSQRPQDLIRLQTSPRIVRWHALHGADKRHAWRIPVLIEPQNPNDPDTIYISALDRIWRGGDYATPKDLHDAQVALLHVAHHVALGDTIEDRNNALVDLAVKIVSLGHHVSRYEIIEKGWFSEAVIRDIVFLAMDRFVETLTATTLPPAAGD